MAQVRLSDLAEIKAHGYAVTRYGAGWILTHESDPNIYTGALMVDPHGAVSPTQWGAVAEAQQRFASDSAAINDTLAASADAIARAERAAGP